MSEMIFPTKFEARMRKLLGAEYALFEESVVNKKNIRSARVNTKKISVEDFTQISPYTLEKIGYNDDGFYIMDDVRMGGEVCHQAGMIYMQEPSAMIPINSVPMEKGWKVLDLCAAPGGKTTQLSNAVDEDGLVISNDIKFERCKALVENVERLGLSNVIITSGTGEEICGYFRNYFDLVLVDSTCSGEGMFRKNPNLMMTWSEKKVASCVAIQKRLLELVSGTIRGNGTLIYSTCTFSVEENEEVVDHFLRAHPEFTLVDVVEDVKVNTVPGIAINADFDFEKTRRFYPHMGRGEGQYVAVMKKAPSSRESVCICRTNKTKGYDLDDVMRFLAQVGVDIAPERIYIRNERVWILPQKGVLLKKHVVNNGVLLGTLSNGTITPSHAFFMAFGHYFHNQLHFSMDDPYLAQYLKGINLRLPCGDGWGVVCVEGCVIGGYFARRNNLQNHYPKELTNKDIFD